MGGTQSDGNQIEIGNELDSPEKSNVIGGNPVAKILCLAANSSYTSIPRATDRHVECFLTLERSVSGGKSNSKSRNQEGA